MRERMTGLDDAAFRVSLPVTEDAAYDAVAAYLDRRTHGTELVIHQKTEGDLWVYYYESARYLRTNDERYALTGHAPILIDTATGEGFVTEVEDVIEEYLAAFRYLRAHPVPAM